MEESLLRAFEGFDGSLDEFFSARRENLEPDIVGDCTWGFDKASCEVEIGLRG
jgi:hypothetical protein